MSKWRQEFAGIFLGTAVILLGAFNPTSQAQSIVLRDLTLIDKPEIASMDIDTLMLSDGRSFPWSKILQGTLKEDQAAFDKFIQELGTPLFRIESRLAGGNYDTLQPITDQLLKRTANTQGRSHYIANAASFHDRLSQGNREAAAVPLINIIQMREQSPELKKLDGPLGLRFSDSICLDLLPIWFDKAAAAQALNEIPKKTINPASAVYRDSLAILVENKTVAANGSESDLAAWGPLLVAQSALLNGNPGQALELVENPTPIMGTAPHALALYYAGLAMRDLYAAEPTEDTATWKLTLLKVPALYQDEYPELSAAAIYQLINSPSNQSNNYKSLQNELTDRFRDTWYGRKFQSNKE